MPRRGVVAPPATDAVLVLLCRMGGVAAASAAVVWRRGGTARDGGSVIASPATEAVVVLGDREAGAGVRGAFSAEMFEGWGVVAGRDVAWSWGGVDGGGGRLRWRSVVAATAAEAVLVFWDREAR